MCGCTRQLRASCVAAVLLVLLAAGCLVAAAAGGASLDAETLLAAAELDTHVRYRWALVGALGAVLALLLLLVALLCRRCCCSRSGAAPGTSDGPGFHQLKDDAEVGAAGQAAEVGAPRGGMCSAADPSEPSPRSRAPLYPVAAAGQDATSSSKTKKRRAALCAAAGEQGPLMPSPRSRGPLYPVPPSAAERALRAQYGDAMVNELMNLKNSEVKRRAKAAGATEEQLDDAQDDDHPKEALRALLLQLLYPDS